MEQNAFVKISWIYILIILFVCRSVHAQNKAGSLANGIIPEIIPPSPEASSLGKYGDWPVSPYTGVPNISIPIYTINVSGYQLPVRLNYHAGGVKVDEVSSWVGTNWSINAGGLIGRTIVGLPDEKEGAGLLYRNQRNNFLKSSYDLSTNDDYIFMKNVSDGNMDTEPDMYFFDFAGFSGKFYFDRSGKFQCIPANNLKLLVSPMNTLINPTDQHWEIADPSGNVYHFGSYLDGGNGFENTMLYQQSPSANNMKTTGWYLTKIILANKADTICFDYTDKSEHYDFSPTNSYKILTNTITEGFSAASGSWDDALGLNRILNNAQNITTTSSSGKCMLNRIRWKSGSLAFTANTARQDLSGTLLDIIQLYNKQGNELKEYQLKYSIINQRSFLDALIEKDALSVTELRHVFEYINRENLPLKGSYAQDHWGFYNGATANISLLPPDPSFNTTALNANREPNETFMQTGTLKKIIYPTGGYTQFEYEAHRYDPASPVGGGSPTSQIVSSTIKVQAGEPQPGGYLRSQNFTIPFPQNIPTIAIQFTNYNKPPSKELARLPLVRIEKLVNGVYQQFYYWDAYDRFPVGNATPNSNGLVDFNINESLSLPPGDYRIVTDLVCGVSNCGTPVVNPGVSAQFIYSSYTGILPIAGGLRVTQITNYDNGAFVSARKYAYSPGNLLLYPRYVHQYGEEVYRLSSCFHDPICDQQNYCTTIYAKYKEITSSSQSILGFTQGAPVGYEQVLEQDVDGTGADKGFTSYGFTFAPDVLNIFNFDPSYWPGTLILNASTPLNSYEYKRGLPWYTNIFKKDANGNYVKIKSSTTTYEFNDNDTVKRYNTIRGMRVKKMRSVNYPCGTMYSGIIIPPPGGNNLTADFAYSYYDLITGWVQKTATTEIFYDENGNNPLSSTTNYTYGNPSHLLVTGMDQYDSKGNLVSVKNKYPDDFAGLTATDNTSLGIKLLQQQSIQNKIIESSSYLTGGASQPVLRSSTFSVYKPLVPYLDKAMSMENRSVVPDFIAASVQGGAVVLDSRYKNQVIYDSYDSYGNLLQAHKLNDVNQSYIWDYDGAYPVAKIINAGANDIAFTSFETSGTGNWTVSSAVRQVFNTVTGTSSYNLASGSISKSGLTAAKTYVVSYWTKNTTSLTIAGTQGIPVKGKTIGGWTYYQHRVAGVTTITVGGTGNVDELRLYPKDAQMTTYTYNPLIGMTSSCDVNNRITYYEYDAFNRLTIIRDQDMNVVKKICYNYSGQPEACSYFYNNIKSQTFTKDCSPGYLGTSVEYSVAERTYTSAISQEDADQKALNEIKAYGQANANNTGTCSPIIYAELTYQSIVTGANTVTGDIVVKFYSDPGLTAPTSVSNLTLNWKESVVTGSATTNNFNTSVANGTIKTLFTGAILYSSSGGVTTTRNYYLTAGTDYTFINSGTNPGGR